MNQTYSDSDRLLKVELPQDPTQDVRILVPVPERIGGSKRIICHLVFVQTEAGYQNSEFVKKCFNCGMHEDGLNEVGR